MQSPTGNPFIPPGTWFKSSYSGANTSECVEAAVVSGVTALRDSKNPLGPQLMFDGPAWTSFVAGLQGGGIPLSALGNHPAP
ncbi:DUF397 domain-containing protein [Streptomyces sp. NBC_01197]|uniref:DUF397 domain-containing protein n=1 Tax=Streptomyces sp. NBC_01197 TaxID=2903768 RepID=UPI002E14499D|nr:DUF397 domain-containing protein [Streptomyces sp. NBC_01197]